MFRSSVLSFILDSSTIRISGIIIGGVLLKLRLQKKQQ